MALRCTLSRLSLAAILVTGVAAAVPAEAMTAKECRIAFNKAKADNTLNGQKYKAFKAAQCGDSAPAATSAKADPAAPVAATAPAATTPAKTEASPPASSATTSPLTTSAAPKAATVASGNVVFPKAIDAQFSKLTPGRARMKTCVAQYNANKATGGNGSLKWIQRGGGYWSQCNTHLKGAQ